MTGILSNQLPGRANPPDADNPLGSYKDRTAPGANDGSYLKSDWFNDRQAFMQAFFIASGLTPNGVEDTGTACQLYDAIINNRWSNIGNYSPGSIVVASNGNEYKCVQVNGRDTSVVDPATATNRDFWVQYPYETVTTASGYALLWHDGKIEQHVEVQMPSTVVNTQTGSFIVPFTDLNSIKIQSKSNKISSPTDIGFIVTESEKLSLTQFNFKALNFDGVTGIGPITGNTAVYIYASGE